MENKTVYFLLVLILLFSFVSKVIRLHLPDDYYFDEIYYGFTAEQYVKGNMKAWVYDFSPPKGFAYTWDHPPVGKLIMAGFIKVFGFSPTSRRLAPFVAGILLTLVVFYLAKEIFPKKPIIWLLSSFFITIDGLVVSMSRIALVDTILTLFICLCVLFLWKKKYRISAVFFGLAISTKWTGIYLLPYIGIYILANIKWNDENVINNFLNAIKLGFLYLLVGALIYIFSYSPLLYEYGGKKFVELQKQMYWYHTGLKATHPYQSRAYTWPFDLKPVWLYVKYNDKTISNIWAMGNPILYWGGVLAFFGTIYYAIKKKNLKLILLLFVYLIFWVPWVFSPRIMFLYHYLPSVPFMCLFLAYMVDKLFKNKIDLYFALIFIFLCFLSFGFFYPYWTNIPVPNDSVKFFQWFETWKPH